MKVYVDELPKSCGECCCYDLEHWECNITNKELYNIKNFYSLDQRHQDCPLRLIADHTKQVRKEVATQMYKILTNESIWKELKSWWLRNGECEELQNCLTAIVEGVAEEEIIKNFGSDRKFYMLLDQIQGE